MPTVSLFYGILISMYFEKDGQHHTPHFHARYGEHKAEVDFNGDLLAGEMPPRQAAYIKAWAYIHQEELRLNWELTQNDEQPFRIDPLK